MTVSSPAAASSHAPVVLDIAGTELNADDRRRLAHPLTGGLILFGRNWANRSQLTSLVAEIKAVRPDVLVVESGEVLIPGPVNFSFDIGLPPHVSYACLAEAALLAMEERFECFTLGRDVPPARVKEIYRLYRRHGFQIAPLRSFGRLLTDELVADKRERAEALLRDPKLLKRVKAEAAAKIAQIPPRAKGVAGLTTLKA